MNKSIKMKAGFSDVLSYILYCRKRKNNDFNRLLKFIELKNIMRENKLKTFFQPIYQLQEDEPIGYEALNRPPMSKWFPTTENFYEFIGQTNQVFHLDLLCRNLSIAKFYESTSDQKEHRSRLLFLNIHPQVLMDSDYKSGETMKLLKQLNIHPSQIIFEITEKQAVSDYVMFERVLSNYRSQGFRIAVDDAGSGFNSLKSIVHIKPEFIKLDRSLIDNISKKESLQKMTSLLLEFANESGTKVIAEGIEQVDDLNYIREIGVHFGQGYALGRPTENIAI
ncbi:EAL domain-containing protein [Evansella sp. AB-P1]|uniref:EAL domain-containing protein n=1 Tax=Evansella sp. AB-P1 TaxID=3037653 RepID=UPI00241C829D|nr:EAL domain-containing protein [Evansella sp. AB-P1]MDG5788060.1 EAL domain-containing protein [Evansella sp. AB-P1]